MMPENNVIISIHSQQTFEGMETETMELVTEGRLQQEKDTYTLSYQESETTGLGSTLTTFQIEKDCITLLRVGEVNSQMVFQEGRRHLSVYETPYGNLSLGVKTHRIRKQLDQRGGEIKIDYRIEIDHQVAGMHLFQIQVREKKLGALPQ